MFLSSCKRRREGFSCTRRPAADPGSYPGGRFKSGRSNEEVTLARFIQSPDQPREIVPGMAVDLNGLHATVRRRNLASKKVWLLAIDRGESISLEWWPEHSFVVK